MTTLSTYLSRSSYLLSLARAEARDAFSRYSLIRRRIDSFYEQISHIGRGVSPSQTWYAATRGSGFNTSYRATIRAGASLGRGRRR
jgi:hypothetical protein